MGNIALACTYATVIYDIMVKYYNYFLLLMVKLSVMSLDSLQSDSPAFTHFKLSDLGRTSTNVPNV